MKLTDVQQRDLELAEEIQKYYADPLGFVLFAFPWGEKGPLENFKGPRPKQERFLIDLGDEIKARRFDGITPVLPIRMAISSGHGEGKSSLIGMLATFLMSSRDGLLGTTTANTGQQLSTKTWAAIETWHKLSIAKHWFELNSEKFYRIGRKNDWFISAQSCAEENSEAFAGQHNAKSTSVYFFDEDSNVPDKIHEVAEGGLTDGESMIFLFGNPTRRQGAFFDVNFGTKRGFWNSCTLGPSKDTGAPAGTRIWDAHDSPYSNKQLQQGWLDLYGFDSDFYRVRVRGLPPNAGDLQFIPQNEIDSAGSRQVRVPLSDEPIIAGVDLSWGGNDPSTIRFRCGTDARSVPRISVPGAQTRDDAVMVMKLTEVLEKRYPCWGNRKVDMVFVDSAGSCGNICRRLRALGFKNIIEVNFGGHAPDEQKYHLMRSYMWGQMKDALPYMAIDPTPDLNADLGAPGFKYTRQTQILLEEKQLIIKRLGHSTDDGDALALTFAMPVKSHQEEERRKAKAARPQPVGAWT